MSDITELFTRDPMSLTDPDIDAIIAEMREKRHAFLADPSSKKTASKKLTAKQEETSKALGDLDLDL